MPRVGGGALRLGSKEGDCLVRGKGNLVLWGEGGGGYCVWKTASAERGLLLKGSEWVFLGVEGGGEKILFPWKEKKKISLRLKERSP